MFNFFSTIKAGIKYMEVFPQDNLIGAVFPECRVKYVMGVGKVLLPPFIVFIVVWNYFIAGGFDGVPLRYALLQNLPVTLVCVLFLLLLPVQGYYWFGKRSKLLLNAKQQNFYQDLCSKLERQANLKPTMYDLAIVLKEGLKKLDRDFLNSL